MVKGIETDNKKYKHKNRNDTKWLAEDLDEIRKTTEKYIDNIRPDEKEIDKLAEKRGKKTMTIDRIIAIILLGIFGPIALISGIYFIILENYVVGVPVGLIGAVFTICFILFEKYR